MSQPAIKKENRAREMQRLLRLQAEATRRPRLRHTLPQIKRQIEELRIGIR